MIFVTGDTHSEFGGRFNTKNFPEQKEMTKDDYVIICGDCGGIWESEESREEKYWLNMFEEKSFTLLFLDGNHDNHVRLKAYPEKQWNGGKVHEIRPHVLHLMRGQIFEIDGATFFTFGGAQSHDIEDGILDPDDPEFQSKKKGLKKRDARFRIKGIDWWEEELPSKEEMDEGLTNLAEHNNTVDYILTHCASTSTQALIRQDLHADVLTEYLQTVKDTVSYKHWIFGHYHDDRVINDKETLVYCKMIRI